MLGLLFAAPLAALVKPPKREAVWLIEVWEGPKGGGLRVINPEEGRVAGAQRESYTYKGIPLEYVEDLQGHRKTWYYAERT